MTSNTRKSKLSSGKQEQYVFTWKAINGWDYNIGESETAASLAMANAIKLKEASTEYKKKFKQKLTFQKIFVRIFVNLIITSMMFLSMLAIYKVAQITEKDTFLKQNAVSITVGAITLLFPPVFELILKLELYRPRTALRVHLFRVLFFYLLNYFTLIYSLFIMLNTLEGEMRANELWQKEQQRLDSLTLNSLAASQYQFHIARAPNEIDWNNNNNQSFYEVISSPLITSSSSELSSSPPQSSHQQPQQRSPFLLFANVYSTHQSSSEKRNNRRNKRFFPFLFKSHRSANKKIHPKRKKKRPKINLNNDGPKERDLSVLYSSNPFPGHELASTTAPPTSSPWTTVQPHFGPLFVGISNPKAIVLPGDRIQQQTAELGTIWESRRIGPGEEFPTPIPHPLNYTSKPKIRTPTILPQPYRASNYDDLCWETLIGQEVAKIVTTDLVMTIAAIMVIDFLRGLWIRYCSDWWCWDIEATFPEYGEFKVAENVLHLVNSQAMVCLGTILMPMLPLINCLKLVAVMYIRAWACMVCNVPAKQVFRASRSSNFYFWLLLAFVCMSTLPVGFVIAYKRPSKNCGPFAGQERFYSIIGKVLQQNLPRSLVEVITYFMSPGIIFPVFLILVLVIYFLVLLVSGLRAANSDLNKQLTLERTEEKRRIFELAKGKSISHKHRPSGESKRSVGGKNGNGREEENDKEVKNGKNGGPPLFFTNEATTKTKPVTGSTLRKSWHGGTGDGNIPAGTENKDFLATPFLTSKHRSPILRQYSDDSSTGGSSPSKSPLRHAGFLPSLASVDENEDEEDEDDEKEVLHGHTEAMIFRRKRSSNASSKQGVNEISSSRRSSGQHRRKSSGGISSKTKTNLLNRPSIQLSWKDRLLLCIGWTDPVKFEEKLRAQLAENDIEKGNDEQQPLLLNEDRRRSRKEGKRVTHQQQPVVLEEAEYSVPSGEDEEDHVCATEDADIEEKTKILEENNDDTIRRKYLNGIPGIDTNTSSTTPRIPSAMSQEESTSSHISSSQQQPSVIVNRLAHFYEENAPPHSSNTGASTSSSSSSSSSIGTGSQRSWVRQQPNFDKMFQLKEEAREREQINKINNLPSVTGRKNSLNGQDKDKSISIERDHVSESSPLSQLNNGRQHRQTIFPSEELSRLSVDKRHPLPPISPKRSTNNFYYLNQKQQQQQDKNNNNGDEYLNILLEEPSTPIGNFRPIQATEMFRETPETASSITTNLTSTTNSSERSDPRLQYANPYSSYAAAMCSPIEPEGSTTLLNNPLQQQVLLPFLQHRRTSTPPAIFSNLFEKEYLQQKEMKKLFQFPSQQKYSSNSFNPSTSSPSVAVATTTNKLTTKTSKIPQHLILGDEGGSTSGRGTMPPGGYGSSPASDSSPEFGHHSKYKISSLSPGRHKREQQELENVGDSSTTSQEGSPKRRFEIRQRSNLGLGRSLRCSIPTTTSTFITTTVNGINNKKKRDDDKTPLASKQSIV